MLVLINIVVAKQEFVKLAGEVRDIAISNYYINFISYFICQCHLEIVQSNIMLT